MTIDATAVRHGPSFILDEYFQATLDVLASASANLGAVLGDLEARGELTDRHLDELVEPLALAVFQRTSPVAFGAGFVASLDLRGPSRGHLSWWQGPMRSQLRLAAQSPSREHIDYSGFEWFRVPHETGEGHVAGRMSTTSAATSTRSPSACPCGTGSVSWGSSPWTSSSTTSSGSCFPRCASSAT